ncbi:hypothetical protein C6P40_002105 [Pichia californica]|uniref:Uncharacterized protein n=1 Tax=Pichia californica TaxID=460514 RepID=A0A9P6WIL1_9ASCO|nr:hypothetical protein C6P42_002156 [[Candida] californica]KAG0687611.1 hypothetical protein C6P40_002105 [[Candida] californica]
MVAFKFIISTTLLSSLVFADEAPSNNDSKKKAVARAHLDRGLVKGIIEFTSIDGVVDVHLDVTGLPPNVGPFHYKIHENKVDKSSCSGSGDVFNPYNSQYHVCDDLKNDAYCSLGDLSGKHGFINTTCFETNYLDQYLSLNRHNPAYVVGKSLVITDPNNNIISCGNIELKSKKSNKFTKRDLIYPGLYNELVSPEEKKVIYTNNSGTTNSSSFNLDDESTDSTSTYSSSGSNILTFGSGSIAAFVAVDAANLCDDKSLGDFFEPIKKDSIPEENIDIDIATGLKIKSGVTSTTEDSNEDNNVSIIQALSQSNLSTTNVLLDDSFDSNPVNYLNESNNFNNTILDDGENDTDSISSTNSIVMPKSNHNSNIAINNIPSGTNHHQLNHQHINNNNNNNNNNSHHLHSHNSNLNHNVSVQDFFFNNPYKTKMTLSSTSIDDVSSLTNNTTTSVPYVENINQGSFLSSSTSMSPQSQTSIQSNNTHNTTSLSRSPYGQFHTPTLVKPKAQLRNITPQPLVNEILPKKSFGEPKLSSMRINRPVHSNLRNLKTASILSLDKKIGSASLNQSSNLLSEKSISDTYNYDSISKDYTNLLQNEEDEVLNRGNDYGHVAPFGGFSRPHKFVEDMDDIFNNSPWKILDFDKGNGSLINSIESSRNNFNNEFKWIGTISIPSNIIPEKIKNEITNELKENYNSNLILLDDEVFQGHYQSFCKQILWPIFHYQIPDNPKSNAFENHSWKFYEKLNQIYANEIASKYEKGDIIWVHDYHLMLLPQMLRKLIPDAKIGFFLHVSFPSSEVFRCLAQRKKILEGMLGADCITFQNEEYMAHFLQSSNRLLLADFNSTGVHYNDRLTTVSYNAIGLDFNRLDIQLKSNIVKNWKNLINDRWPNKKLIVSRDKIDKIRGLKEKLLAYERFLDDHPEYISKTILILICIQSKSFDEDYKNELLTIAERINSKTKNISIDQPVILLNQDIEFEQYLALLSEADTFIVSTLREGMNLTCHEFICASQKLHSPLILSEFVGSASVLNNGPLLSNPYNIRQVSSQIYQCLNMLNDEKIERWNSTFEQILNNDSKTWIKKCLLDIDNACQNANVLQSYNTLTPLTKQLYQTFINDVSKSLGSKRLYILNLDDLTSNLEIHGQTIHSYQQELIQKTLSNLTSNSNNYVYIFSLFQRYELLRLYKRLPDLGLIAENGGIIKPPRSNDWYTVVEESEKTWIPTVVDIIKSFCERIPGSHIEVEECTILFHTESTTNIDKDYKEGLIGDLITHINELFEKEFNVHASITKGILIVKEMNLISRALDFIIEQDYIKENENVKKLPYTSSAFTSPVFHARSSSIPQSPITPIELSSISGIPSRSSSSLSSSPFELNFEFIFSCGETTSIDEEIFSYFNNLVNDKEINENQIITVCAGQTGQSKTCAKYSLKGINNLMTLLN